MSSTETKPVATAVAELSPAPTLAATLEPMNTGAIVLRQEQQPLARDQLASLDFATIPSADIISIGLGAEQNLGRTLDGFLARLDKKTAAKVFDLFGRLQKGVEDANLPEILKKVQEGEQEGFFMGLVNSVVRKLTGKNADDAAREFMEELTALITGRTRTLANEMQKLEGELDREMQVLSGELNTLEQLKHKYAEHFAEFTVDAAVARAFVDKATAYVRAEAAAADPADLSAQARVRELEQKLRLLESRALALEGTYTRLPADRMVIEQVQAAGVATLQETATTIAARFASIKMTLLSIHGAFAVKTVQQLSARSAQLDEQLTKVRAEALKDVAVTAAKQPGDNRLAQAKQIEAVIASTREIDELVEAAKKETDAKFDAARASFEQSRAALVELHQKRG
ncbi:MAG TPA: hypothetical protein VFL14_05115 [Xanthomonadales bacterium]|nr:hypothetical protein [Xanthomonadales bacterium]